VTSAKQNFHSHIKHHYNPQNDKFVKENVKHVIPFWHICDAYLLYVCPIMREFIEGHCLVALISASAVIWGAARTKPHEPVYHAAVETARLLALANFGIITGGGPGILEAGAVGLPMGLLANEPQRVSGLSTHLPIFRCA
jgi:hypothetical protein